MKYAITLLLFAATCTVIQAQSGCQDPAALNYDENASIDSENCIYPLDCEAGLEQFAFVFGLGVNYNYSAQLTNLSFQDTILSINGFTPFQHETACLNPDSCYVWHIQKGEGFSFYTNPWMIVFDAIMNPIANIPAGSGYNYRHYFNPAGQNCGTGGCMDETALNYSPNATINYGCAYCTDNTLIVRSDTLFSDVSNAWAIYQNDSIFQGGLSQYISAHLTRRCLPDGCYEFRISPLFGAQDATFRKYYLETEDGQILWEGFRSHNDTIRIPLHFNVPDTCTPQDAVYGCNNALAVNYNPAVTHYDGSCNLNNDLCAYTFEFVLDTVNAGAIYIDPEIQSSTYPWVVQWNIADSLLFENNTVEYTFIADGPVTVCAQFYAYDGQWFGLLPYCQDSYCLEFDPEQFGFSPGDPLLLQSLNDDTGIPADNGGNIRCYPNPTSGAFWIDLGAIAGRFRQLSLFNTKGALIRELTSPSDADLLQLDLSDVPPGLYFIQVNTTQAAYRQKVIVR